MLSVTTGTPPAAVCCWQTTWAYQTLTAICGLSDPSGGFLEGTCAAALFVSRH